MRFEHAVTYRILVHHKSTKSFKNVCFSICFVLLSGVLYENLQNNPPLFPRPTLTLKCLGLRVCVGKGWERLAFTDAAAAAFYSLSVGTTEHAPPHRKEEIKLFARIKRSKLRLVGEMFGAGVVLCMFLSTLQQNYHLCISRKGIARPQPQFPHSCVCERFITSRDRSTYFPSAE